MVTMKLYVQAVMALTATIYKELPVKPLAILAITKIPPTINA